ncbi:hypothetical protein LTR17_000039 [Elasticomyces elasticus]|nr:hypothetical protein LTR17_000039 [Elasticomyces elasticus]
MSDNDKVILVDLLSRMVRYGKSLPSPDDPATVEAARVAREAADERAAAAAQEESEDDKEEDGEEGENGSADEVNGEDVDGEHGDIGA